MRHPSDISSNPQSSLGFDGSSVAARAFQASEIERGGASDTFNGLRKLIWLYFWLLMAEGALRKWILPGFSNPLLIVRDPVLILCYIVAIQQGAFPRTAFLPWIIGLAGCAVLFSVGGIWAGTSQSTIVVTLYGLRASFGHLPLIFLIARVFTRRDVEQVGRWLVVMAPPMAVLVFLQYRAPVESWINSGAGLDSAQIGVAVTGVEKVRPPGIFSYNTGLAAYLALLAASLIAHYLVRGTTYGKWLGIAAGLALIAIVPLALSRSTLAALIIVALAGVVCMLRGPGLGGRGLLIAVAVVAGVGIVGSFSVFREGLGILQSRIEEAQGIKVGVVERFIDLFTKPVKSLSEAPLFGAGIGVGTNVGAKLISGRRGFLLSEGEWERDVDEMGPLLGSAYILLRIALVWHMAMVAWRSLRGGNPLSFLLLSAGGLSLLNGNFSTPTSLGFAVFTAGLCLAAAKDLGAEESMSDALEQILIPASRIRGRSLYAEKLHGARRTS
jgi:hypothetical protein